ncbi:hypothetical protein UPYG_G00145180 [Umbra pygmaea]|uniref:Uncharacterized protein n=1 Tax=Umbra pygmaea TaxID=75934 RepID=A0ABD0X0I2_UMBPY
MARGVVHLQKRGVNQLPEGPRRTEISGEGCRYRMSNHRCNSSQRKCQKIWTSIRHWSCPQGKWTKSC